MTDRGRRHLGDSRPVEDTASAPDAAPGGRLAWLDLARALALLAMVLAHFAPPPPGFDPSEYLAAPLFAFLMGVSAWLSWQRRSDLAIVVDGLWRAIVLVALGWALQRLSTTVDVVLEELGLLQLALALVWVLGRHRRLVVAAVGLVAFVAAPALLGHFRTRPLDGSALTRWLTATTVAGAHYRLTTFLVFGIAGVLTSRWLVAVGRRDVGTFRTLSGIAAALVGSGLALALLRDTRWGWHPYRGSVLEQVGAPLACLALTAVLAAALGERAPRPLTPLIALGRTALTCYVVQVLLAELLVRTTPFDPPSAVLTLLVLAGCLAVALLCTIAVPTGPLEWLLRRPLRAVTGPARASSTDQSRQHER